MVKKVAILNIYQNKVNRGAETFVTELSKRLSSNYQVDVIWDVNYFELFKRRYDYVIPTNGRLQVVLVRIITWFTGGKMIVSGQSGKGFDDRINLYSFPNAFVPISSYSLKWAKKVNPFVKSIYIPNGVDLKEFSSHVNPYDIGLKGSVILCVAALVSEKRLDLLIRAVAKTNVSLLLVGKGELKDDLQKLGEDMLGERFNIMAVSHKDMPGIYSACDIFSYPIVPWESFGIVLVEALSCGLPVVATDDPIRREIVGEAGLFVNPTDTEKYAETLEKALNMKWGNKPRQEARKFDWDIVAKKYRELFEALT